MEERKVPVSRRAVYARVDRALRRQGETLRTSRSQRSRIDLGDLYVLDIEHNCVVAQDVNLEALARELDAISPWECVTD